MKVLLCYPKNAQQGTEDYLDSQIDFIRSLPASDSRNAIGAALFDAKKKAKLHILK